MNLDTYMDDFGRDLARATRKRPRRRLVVAIPTAVGLATVGVIAIPRGHGIDAIAEARQALAPANEIVHMKITFKLPGRARMIAGGTEQWYAADPPRWKTRSIMPSPKGRATKLGGMVERVYSGDRMRIYLAKRDVAYINRGVKVAVKPVGAPGPGVAGGDPATELRKQLDAGDLRDDGVVTHDGKQVRRLVREQKIGKRNVQQFVYYMDPQTFAPLGGVMRFFLNGNRRASSFEFVISDYQRIPLNAESERLLKLTKTPDTKYVWRDVKGPARPSSAARPARRPR